VVLGVTGVAAGLALLAQLDEAITNAKTLGQQWQTSAVFFNYAVEIGLPLILAIGSIAGLKRRPRARLILLIYAWSDVGFAAFLIGSAVWNLPRYAQSMIFFALIHSLETAVWRAAFPAVLLILLMKQPIADLFRRRDTAFEVLPPPPTQ
jgi:hypothetical protein